MVHREKYVPSGAPASPVRRDRDSGLYTKLIAREMLKVQALEREVAIMEEALAKDFAVAERNEARLRELERPSTLSNSRLQDDVKKLSEAIVAICAYRYFTPSFDSVAFNTVVASLLRGCRDIDPRMETLYQTASRKSGGPTAGLEVTRPPEEPPVRTPEAPVLRAALKVIDEEAARSSNIRTALEKGFALVMKRKVGTAGSAPDPAPDLDEKTAMEAFTRAMEQGQAHPEHEVRHLLKMCTVTHLNDNPIEIGPEDNPSLVSPENLNHHPERLGRVEPVERLDQLAHARGPGPVHPVGKGPDQVHPVERGPGPVQSMEKLGPVHPVERGPGPAHPVERGPGPVHRVERGPGPVHPVERGPGPVHPVERGPGPVHPVERGPGPVHPVERGPGPVHPVEREPSPVHPVERGPGPVHPVERGPGPVHPVERGPGPVHPVERGPGPVHPVERGPGPVHPVERGPGPVHPVGELSQVGSTERLDPVPQHHDAGPLPSSKPSDHTVPVGGPPVAHAHQNQGADLGPAHDTSPSPAKKGRAAFKRASAVTKTRGDGSPLTQGHAVPKPAGPMGFKKAKGPSAGVRAPHTDQANSGLEPPGRAMFGRRDTAATVGQPEQVVHSEHDRVEGGGVVTTDVNYYHNMFIYQKMEVFGPDNDHQGKGLVWPQVYRYPEAQPPPVIESPRESGNRPVTPPTEAQSADHSGSERSVGPRVPAVRPRPPIPQVRRVSRGHEPARPTPVETTASETAGPVPAELPSREELVVPVKEGPTEVSPDSVVNEASDHRLQPKHGPVEGPQGQRVIHMMKHEVEEITGIGELWSSDSSLSDDAEAKLAKKGFRAQADAKKVPCSVGACSGLFLDELRLLGLA
ncbi:hypothetical protein Pmar_PMAR009970 [Perkinsus marinus ATCC 50983]|uniref:Uncharacterized protein n=1 Tax=Perkinsus marinus (strain ATCC 50983 / TXsc) TaxID=423536 RepID=C5L2R3_PERM5|nr:hypothetical protein Pmar_PMAR009970 [Perkinsus marinus ATCC 50983]EER08978.1 hypothetical protein Pmar_PMAR009970 [Perkinsus marinus ATCC 50983]|eukprot:XP_002777162.1 hypothetical protein Pmar_PMAR009970 [Perkinsus marinus ATCC 50983]